MDLRTGGHPEPADSRRRAEEPTTRSLGAGWALAALGAAAAGSGLAVASGRRRPPTNAATDAAVDWRS